MTASKPNNERSQLTRLLTVEELADLLRVPIKTIYTWRYHGEGPPAIHHVQFGRRTWRIECQADLSYPPNGPLLGSGAAAARMSQNPIGSACKAPSPKARQ